MPSHTIAAIQARFPHPHRAGFSPVSVPGSYCVGGALCLSTDRLWYWPDRRQLTLALLDLNPTLSQTTAFWYATRIIGANDREEFARAWAFAARALHPRSDAEGETISST